jgi:predicted lipoprotein with Yx(FWY)xxD motif
VPKANIWLVKTSSLLATAAIASCGNSGGEHQAATASNSTTQAHSTVAPPVTVLTVKTVHKAGKILAAGPEKMTVYAFEGDRAHPSKSTCVEACAATWPPVTTGGQPIAGRGVDASKLSVIKRSDGTTQLSYNNHPLYYYSGDTSASDIRGEGVRGLWYILAPEGIEILL